MLRVATQLRPSSIHGIGVFAAEPISAGAEVWRFSPGYDLDLDPSVVLDLPKHLTCALTIPRILTDRTSPPGTSKRERS